MATLRIKLETKYEDGSVSALVENFGREYAVVKSERGLSINRTNGNCYERIPAWKVKADIAEINRAYA